MMFHSSHTSKAPIKPIAQSPKGLLGPPRDAASSDRNGKCASEGTCPLAVPHLAVNGGIIDNVDIISNGTMGQYPLYPGSLLMSPPRLQCPPHSVASRQLPVGTIRKMGYSPSPPREHPQGISYLHQAHMPMFGQSVSLMGQSNASPVEPLPQPTYAPAYLQYHSPQTLRSRPSENVHLFPPLENVRLKQTQLSGHLLSRDSLVQPHHSLLRPQGLTSIHENPPIRPSIRPAFTVSIPPYTGVVSLDQNQRASQAPSPLLHDKVSQVTQNAANLPGVATLLGVATLPEPHSWCVVSVLYITVTLCFD